MPLYWKGVIIMDHVIGSLRRWLDIYKDAEPENKRAHQAIEKALEELYKYQYESYYKKK